MSYHNKNPNNHIHCVNNMILGNKNDPSITPITIDGVNGRDIVINGVEVAPKSSYVPKWESMTNFISRAPGAGGINLIINPNGGIVGNGVATRTGYQDPEIILIPVAGSNPPQAQVFCRGSIQAAIGFVSTANAGQSGAIINLPQGTAVGSHCYAPPGVTQLHFINAGQDDNTLLGATVTGLNFPIGTNPITINSAIVNVNGGNVFSFDGLSWFVDFIEGGKPAP